MSTLDGILVALSSVAANDLFLKLSKNNLLKNMEEKKQAKVAYFAGQGILVLMGVVTFLLVIHPPKLLGIFGQLGAYAIVTASLAPILCGILFPKLKKEPIIVAVFAALTTYSGLYSLAFFKVSPTAVIQFSNPAVPAVYGIFVSLLISVPMGYLSNIQKPVEKQEVPS